MLKIRQMKAKQDAEKAAAAAGGATAAPVAKQTAGQLRIQKGAQAAPAQCPASGAHHGGTASTSAKARGSSAPSHGLTAHACPSHVCPSRCQMSATSTSRTQPP